MRKAVEERQHERLRKVAIRELLERSKDRPVATEEEIRAAREKGRP
jgi:hypothetical protein